MTENALLINMEKRLSRLEEENAQLRRELERHEERTEGLSAKETFNRTQQYVKANPRVWERIKFDAAAAVVLGERFSIAKGFETLRASKFLQKHENETYKCNNSYRACLTRMLVSEFPDLARKGLVSLRKSKIDKFFPELEELVA